MKLGIIGLPGSGKTTVFEVLTADFSGPGGKSEKRLGSVPVPDERIDILTGIYQPQKITYARVEYFLPARLGKSKEQNIWVQIRDCDALIHVIRNFTGTIFPDTSPYRDFQQLDQEMILSDQLIVEKRLDNLAWEIKKGRAIDKDELKLLEVCREKLENGIPLRKFSDLAADPLLKGFAFVSGKPALLLANNDDEDDSLPDLRELSRREVCLMVKGRLEHELARMDPEEAADFLEEYQITVPALDRVIRKSYELLGLISFFTVGEDEVRAWTIRKGTPALTAASAIHSDITKGFIRAEVLAYDDLMASGNYQAARKQGLVRLEGKTYPVQDGDLIDFRFSV